jgi:ubiquinone/menaquinone biosynthesis C-methylase UbiE
MSLRDRVFAAGYDPLTARWEERHGAKLRKKLLEHARGRVLEIGVGTGLNLPHYPPVDELVAADPSEPMLRRARRRAAETGREVTFVEALAEQLPFEDDSFDTVVSMLVLCTVENQQRALQEIRRVLRPNGQFLFSEHVHSEDPKRARWQDRLEPIWGEWSPTAATPTGTRSTRSAQPASTSAASTRASYPASRSWCVPTSAVAR